MIRELGSYNTSASRTHVRFQFSTHAATGGNVAPSSAFEAADIRIYKAADGAAYSATQRSSANGVTMTSPFDSLTGVHDVDIDLTDNTDAGFYAAGCRYAVVLAPDETVDSQTITGVVLAEFEIGPPPANVTQVSGDATAADNLEAALDGTGSVTITANVTGNITGNLTGSVGSLAAQAKADVNAEVLDVLNVDTLIDGKTFVQAVQYVSAITAGRVSGAGTGTEVFKGLDESTTRVTVTVDGSGNRTDIVYG